MWFIALHLTELFQARLHSWPKIPTGIWQGWGHRRHGDKSEEPTREVSDLFVAERTQAKNSNCGFVIYKPCHYIFKIKSIGFRVFFSLCEVQSIAPLWNRYLHMAALQQRRNLNTNVCIYVPFQAQLLRLLLSCLFVLPVKPPQQASSYYGNTPRSVSEWNLLCLPAFPLCDVKPCCWAAGCASKTDRMKEKIMCWPHWLVQSNISDQSVKEWTCIRVRGVCCLYRWSLYDSCCQGRSCDQWLIVNTFFPLLLLLLLRQRSEDRIPGHLFGFTRLAEARPQSVTRPRGKQLLDTGARRRREKRRCCGWDPSSGVIWVKARSRLEPSDSTRNAVDSGRWHGKLPAHHVTRVRCCPTSQAGQDSLLRSPQMLFWEAYWNKSGEPHGRIT